MQLESHKRRKGRKKYLRKQWLKFDENYKVAGSSMVAHTVKNLPANPRYPGLIPGLGRTPGEMNGYPFQCSGLENPMDRGAWRATVHGGHKESDTTEHRHTH